jgi:hypothetical protein
MVSPESVNGVVAHVDGNVFAANHLPISPGSNTITVVGTALDGTTYQKSITVFGQPDSSYIELTSNLESGISPLTVTLNAETFLSSPVASSYLTFTGPAAATVAFVSNTQYNVTMNTEGMYVFTLYITDTQGRIYQDSVAINVVSLTAIDTLLRSKWEGMKDALGQGSIEQAMGFFAQSSRERYQGIFNVVQSQLSDIVEGMSAIQIIHIDNGVAKYRIRRQEAAGLITYYIYFVMDEDGIWRIKQF